MIAETFPRVCFGAVRFGTFFPGALNRSKSYSLVTVGVLDAGLDLGARRAVGAGLVSFPVSSMDSWGIDGVTMWGVNVGRNDLSTNGFGAGDDAARRNLPCGAPRFEDRGNV